MKYVVIDLETDGLGRDCNIHCVGFACRDGNEVKSYCKPWNEGGRDLVIFWLTMEDAVFVVHNAAFDIAVLRQNGINIPPGRYVCTFVMAYLTDPGCIDGHSLERWGNVVGCPKSDKPKSFTSLTQEMMDYCRQDCVTTLKVFEYLQGIYTRNERLLNVYNRLELPYVEVVMALNRTGMYVDQAALEELDKELTALIAANDKQLIAEAGLVPTKVSWNYEYQVYVPEETIYRNGVYRNPKNLEKYKCNPIYDHCPLGLIRASQPEVIAWLLMRRGWKPTIFSDNGKPKLDEKVMKAAQSKFDIVSLIMENRKLNKLKGTYVDTMKEMSAKDGFVRGQFNQCRTDTTRLSSSEPNMQNIPARSELGKKIRKCIIAPPGFKMVVGDLDRIELVVLAYYLEQFTGDHGMSDEIRKGTDIHAYNAARWGCTRDQAKTVIFLINYGGGPSRLAGQLGISRDEAEDIMRGVHEAMPSLKTLMEDTIDYTFRNNCILNDISGHWLTYKELRSNDEALESSARRRCFNGLIQGGAGAVFKEMQLRIFPLMISLGVLYSCVVHDELVLYVPEYCASMVVELLNGEVPSQDILVTDRGPIPIRIDFKIYDNWGDAKG